MKLLVGLGNPGKEYAKTRHNAGFMALGLLKDALGFDEFSLDKKFEALVSEGTYSGEKVILALPQTFMNLSGESLRALIDFYKIPLADLIVAYDDLDLPLGKIRLRLEGSPGTHNGMKSITEILGTQNFPRLRIGIESRGESAPEQQETASFVLTAFTKEEDKILQESLKKAVLALKMGLEDNLAEAMNRYN